MAYKAYLFDLNGTIIDDMQYHFTAWHRILNDLGADISLERARQECYGKNAELLERIFPGRFTEAEIESMSLEKERQYQENFRPHLKLLNGLDSFFDKAHQQDIRMAIGSAAILFNIDFVLDGLDIRKYFGAIVSAEDVVNSKPDPETFIKCAAMLGIDPADCLVFEDAPKGVESAANAGMKCVVLLTSHTREEFAGYDNIVCFAKDYTEVMDNE